MAEAPPLLEFAEDLPQMKKEYSDFVKEIKIDESKFATARILTNEGYDIDVQVTAQGWTITQVHDGSPSEIKQLEGETFEGCEALLMAVSSEFGALWHRRLADKLQELTKDQEKAEGV